MDASHYDKIADKLIQFNSKLGDELSLEWEIARFQTHQAKKLIEQLLKVVDDLAWLDERGFLR